MNIETAATCWQWAFELTLHIGLLADPAIWPRPKQFSKLFLAIHAAVSAHQATKHSTRSSDEKNSLTFDKKEDMKMKKYAWIAGIAVAVAGIASLAYAAERQVAVSDTTSTLEIIESGLDWDGTTSINQQQQAERMDANVSVLVDQKGQRNFSGGLGLALLAAGAGAVVVGRKS